MTKLQSWESDRVSHKRLLQEHQQTIKEKYKNQQSKKEMRRRLNYILALTIH
jgi:hypothetical protein